MDGEILGYIMHDAKGNLIVKTPLQFNIETWRWECSDPNCLTGAELYNFGCPVPKPFCPKQESEAK